MERIKNYLLGSMVLVILVLVLTLAQADVRRAVAEEFKDVRVINTESMPAQVRDVDNPSRHPIHFGESYTVPAGKRLVIEYISMEIRTSNQCGLIRVAASQEGSALHVYDPKFVGFSSGYNYGISQETLAYIGPNRTVTFGIYSQAGCGNVEFGHVGATGHLVEMQ